MQRCEEEEKEREETVINTKDLFLSQFKSGDLSQMFVPKGAQMSLQRLRQALKSERLRIAFLLCGLK